MNKEEEITLKIDELQAGVRLLIDMPGEVTINCAEYRDFYNNVQGFASRYDLNDTLEWREVEKWLIKKPNEYLTLEEAGFLKQALEKLRLKAFAKTGVEITRQVKTENEQRVEKSFEEIILIGHEQANLLKQQIKTLEDKSKSSQRWNWIMFITAIIGIAISIFK